MKKLSELYVQNWATFVRMDMVAYASLEDDDDNGLSSICLYDKNMKLIFETWFFQDDGGAQQELDNIIDTLREYWFIVN